MITADITISNLGLGEQDGVRFFDPGSWSKGSQAHWGGGSGLERLLKTRAPEILRQLKEKLKEPLTDVFPHFAGRAAYSELRRLLVLRNPQTGLGKLVWGSGSTPKLSPKTSLTKPYTPRFHQCLQGAAFKRLNLGLLSPGAHHPTVAEST